MKELKNLPAWERLFKRIVWEQLGDLSDKKILDFGSGEGITADHFAEKNDVIAVEPWDEMLKDAWRNHEYKQIVGDVTALKEFPEGEFDVIICHNVLEYIDDKAAVLAELQRVLKPGGFISIVKHNRAGRVMQMAVLLDDFDKALGLLDGENSSASKFGAIRYYEDCQVEEWCDELIVENTLGIRAFWDLQQNQEKHTDEEWQTKMAELEMRVSDLEPYKSIAFFHHLILRKRV
ncbi:MAG: methyltransferase domain-containing protein [Eubacterium sp.]|nr:methyltransferase domain-containing protein [Eubacterium sp.]